MGSPAAREQIDRSVMFRYIDQADRTILELRAALEHSDSRAAAERDRAHREREQLNSELSQAREAAARESLALRADGERARDEAAFHESRWRELLASRRRKVLVALGVIRRTAWEKEAAAS